MTQRSLVEEPLADDSLIWHWGHPTHVHDFHQFLYVPVGRIAVTARGRTHHLESSTALWVPAGVPHSAEFGIDSLIVVEGFDPDRHALPFTEATSVTVTESQRRLLLSRLRSSEEVCGDEEVFAALDPGARPGLPLPLPLPRSRTAAAVARDLMHDPGDPRTAAEWAREHFTSSTSLRRAFQAETGLAFSQWRTRLRLNHSLTLLEQGLQVGAVAARVGFTSTNGYILAFRRHFGQTPGAYTRQVLGSRPRSA